MIDAFKIIFSVLALIVLSVAVGSTIGTFAAYLQVGTGAAAFGGWQFAYSLCGTLGSFIGGLYAILQSYEN
jgi:hypothetical protein